MKWRKTPMRIRPASEIEKYFKLLVYGPPGVGKTSLAATLDPERTLFLNIEGGMISVAGTKARVTDQLKRVDQVEEIFWKLAQGDDELQWVTTVVLDSATELQTINIEGIVSDAVAKNPNKRSKDEIQIQDYGRSTARLKRLFRLFRDLPMHVIITALSKDRLSNGENKRVVATIPYLTEKLSASLMGYMDYVWYMQVLHGIRTVCTQDFEAIKAKTRGHRFAAAIGDWVTEPHLATLYRTLLETETPP